MQQALETLFPLLPQGQVDTVRLALRQPGKILSVPSDGFPAGEWALLTTSLIEYCGGGGTSETAIHVALAVECAVCAIDIQDDLLDGDRSALIEEVGSERAWLCSTTLLYLARQSLRKVTGDAILIRSLLDVLACGVEDTADGQMGDLVAEALPYSIWTREQYLDLAGAKGGRLMQLVWLLAARAAGASPETCDRLASVGFLCGTAHQLKNDARDFASAFFPAEITPLKTDVLRRKKTLPCYYAQTLLARLEASALHPPFAALASGEYESARQAASLTEAIALLYLEHAAQALRPLHEDKPFPVSLQRLLGLEI